MSWSWKDPDRSLNPELNLRYEPGNWGDILKALWLSRLLPHLGEAPRYLDPHAGARDYPLLPGVTERLFTLPSPYRDSKRLPSSAGLVEEMCPFWHPALNELDDARRASWGGGCQGQDGLAFLQGHLSGTWDLVLWDPYDFFEQWSHALPDLIALSRKCPVLIYLYNKSPRGVSQARQYRDMRERLKDVPLWCGRLPSDACLPRAFHEVLLLGVQGLPEELRESLREVTRLWAAEIAANGAFES